MPSSDWTLIHLPLRESSNGIAGYAVLDALGLSLGYVSGWVKGPDEKVRMMKLALSAPLEAREYLVPIGSITLIDDSRSQIQLRELTKRSLPKYCIEFIEELPEPRLLTSLIRYFPNPRPVVVERLERPDDVPSQPMSRLSVHHERGDGTQAWMTPVRGTGPSWTRLEHLTPPD